jgi:hypothetical protein
MPVINLGSQAFSPIGEESPTTPPTPGGAGEKDTDAMEEDGKAPADLGEVTAADIFGDSEDEQDCIDCKDMPQEPTWGGGCTSPKQPCRLIPKNYKKKPPMHSGSVYNAAELVRSTSTYTACKQSPPANFTTPEKPSVDIDSLLNKETPLPSFLKQTLSDCDDVDTN